ncbi:MAG: hypothetical protein K6A95_03255 [Bacteroidales bacterium]|nr:hypothetical protein [Bacteroidales bacterium]
MRLYACNLFFPLGEDAMRFPTMMGCSGSVRQGWKRARNARGDLRPWGRDGDQRKPTAPLTAVGAAE